LLNNLLVLSTFMRFRIANLDLDKKKQVTLVTLAFNGLN